MANTFTLNSASYNGRYMYVTCNQTIDIESNTSTIEWELTVTGGNSTNYTTGPTTVTINGTKVYYMGRLSYSTKKFPVCPGTVSGVIQVPHDTEGHKSIEVSISTAIYSTTVKATSGTWELDSIPRYATIKTAPNFTDEESPVITYSNPAGSAVTSLQACISLDGSTDIVKYRDIPIDGTSYTFALTDAERNTLRAATPNSNTLDVEFYVRTVIGGKSYHSTLPAVMRIVNANPTISPVVVDTNSATIAVTGSNAILVASQSTAQVTINAAAQKYATIKSKKVEHGGATLTDDGTLSAISANPIKFTATDSRGNSTTVNATNTIVPYILPTCSIGNNMPTTDGTFSLVISGKWYNGSIGATTNALTVQYRYKAAGGSYGDWITISGATLNGNNYKATANLTGLDYKTVYTFQAKVTDALVSATSNEKAVIAAPVFDWGQNDFNFNVPVTIKGEPIADFVIERGTSGIWTYEKYSSGSVKLWGVFSVSNLACTAALGGMFRTDALSIDAFPFTVTDPNVVASYESDGYGAMLWATSTATALQPPSYYLIRPTSATIASGKINFYVTGKWK